MRKSRYTGINRFIKSDKLQILFNKIGDGTISDFVDDWKWIFSFSKKYKWVIFFYTVLGILSSTLALVAAYVSKILINIIVEKQHQNLWILITVMLSSTILSLVLGSVLSRINTKISIYVNNDIQASIFDRIVDARWIELNKYSNGDLLNRFSNDVGTVSGNAIGWIPNLIINIYTFTATFIVLFRTDPNMAWIALGSAPFLLIMSKFIMSKMREYKKRVLEMNSQMMSFEVETFYNFDTIKSFGISDRYSKRLKWWQGKYKEYNLDYNKFEIKANILMTLVTTAVSMVAFGYCLFKLWTGQILYGDMTFFLTQRSSLSSKFNALVKTVPGMVTSAVSAHRIRELVDLPKEDHYFASVEKISEISKDGITVAMEDVDFGYIEGKNVYEHGNFTARPGEIIAVLGPSGEGKTTMLRLLLGLIKPDSGRITLSGKNGEAVDMNADLREFFSYVPQGNTILSGTIADNLRMVKEDATDEELIEVLKLSCAWDFIREHPQTIYATLGERGAGLSEGQAQRISIARALLRDAPILLLDEATSALDTDTEQRVLDNIIKGRPNKTFIISTHRKSVLSQCNRVYFIKNKHTEEFIMNPSNKED